MQMHSGSEYLKIDIANNFGLDKKDWDERKDWFDQHELKLDSLIKQADEPALFFSGIQAWKDYKNKKPIHYPISLDATSSGIQILSALTGDREAAKLCNVVDTGHREDAYNGIYNHMLSMLDEAAKIDRKLTKQAIMTAFYGSTAMPKNVFGEGRLLEVFYESLETLAPGAWELNQAMLALWNPDALSNDWILPDNFHVHVPVMQTVTSTVHWLNKPYDVNYVINAPMDQGRSLGANMTHSIDGMMVREMLARCYWNQEKMEKISALLDPNAPKLSNNRQTVGTGNELVIKLWKHYERTGFLSARILDVLTANNIGHVDKTVIHDLVCTMPKKPFQVIAVHDCFRCLPQYGNDLRKQYNQILSDISRSNLLSDILSQITGRVINTGKLDNSLWKDILHADYALS